MMFSKAEVESFDSAVDKHEEKKELVRIRKRGSYLNYDLDEPSDTSKPEPMEPIPEPKKRHLHPLYLMQQAFKKVTAVGSSTALIGVLNKRSLSFANLGDSGFVYYRQQECKMLDDR
jgi:hypothetical protein